MIHNILSIIDNLLFIYIGVSVFYLFVFAFFSRFRRSNYYPPATTFHRFVILFPAYKEDQVIESSVCSFLLQEYPRERYDVVVISDQMNEETNNRLEKLPLHLFRVNFKNSSKAKAMNFAMEQLKEENFDIVVVMDADNAVEPDFLEQINRSYQAGAMAIQAHRKAKNMNTDVAILDAASEEMNNAYFRKGHVFLGLSSALSGSGMAFDYSWFRENIKNVFSSGEDKELEALLLKQRIYIEYLDDVHVYDEKIQTSSGFYKQRQRWLAAQFGSLKRAVHDLPHAILSGNIDYVDKLLQWMMLPRVLMLGLIPFMGIILLLVNWNWTIKWWGLFLGLLVTFGLAIPKDLDNKKLEKAMRKIPLLFLLMFFNLFRLKGMNKKFNHSEHGTN